MNGASITTASLILGAARTHANGVDISASGPPPGDWWDVSGATCVAAYQPKGAADLAASYSNLANPGTNDAAPGTAPTWNSTDGWVFASASSQYLTTGIVPASGWSMIVRFTGAAGTAVNMWMVGVNSGGDNKFYLSPSFALNDRLYGGGGFTIIGGDLASGVMCISNNQPYLDGSTDGGTVTAWSGTQTDSVFIGCLNNGGSPLFYWNGNIQAMAIYSTTLTGGNVASLTTAINAV